MSENTKHSIPDDIVEQARLTDLYTFLCSVQIKTSKAGSGRYNVDDVPGLVIYQNVYFYFYDDSFGNAIDFLITFFNYDFKSAVNALTGFSTPHTMPVYTKGSKQRKKPAEPFQMPILNAYQPRVMAYLNKSRYINNGLIKSFLKHKLLFQTKEYGNCLFPWYYNGEIVGAEIIGTLDQKKFKKIQPGSKGGYGFNFSHPASTSIDYLYFFESAIDLMSYLSLQKIKFNVLYISMGGLKPSKIEYFSSQYPNAAIKLCIDNDEVSEIFIENLKEVYSFESELPPNPFKDYNDLLRLTADKL